MNEKISDTVVKETKVSLLVRNIIGIIVSAAVLTIIVAIGIAEYLLISNLPLQPPYVFLSSKTLEKFHLPTYCPSPNNTKCCDNQPICELTFDEPKNVSLSMKVN
jgi:hypothetical protein